MCVCVEGVCLPDFIWFSVMRRVSGMAVCLVAIRVLDKPVDNILLCSVFHRAFTEPISSQTL